ncbi:malonyl-ACP O-methyltransferase [Allohahella marinimesophila]|uniref:Malonyl-[acyl-carrier protein] O-methyltransferase n=1 Tax=Allohahella marinimesophila TaxID=1054972 RepID=A0ABP7PNS4_9GAMM
MDKRHVDRSFSLASKSYDDHASIQRRIGESLLNGLAERLKHKGPQHAQCRVIDAGCGTGYFTDPLASLLRNWRAKDGAMQADARAAGDILLVALDRSAGMLDVLAEKHGQTQKPGVQLAPLQADLECLPLYSNSCDVVFSNLAMQWLEQPSIWLDEAVRVLRPGGWLVCSTLLPGSLIEIQAAWAGLDQAQHINNFEPLENLQAAAPPDALVTRQRFTEYFPSALDAMRSVKAVGAHTVLHGARQQLTTPGRMKAVLAAYEQQRQPEGVPLSYEAGFISYQKPM